MELNVQQEVARLQRMTTRELRERYAEVFGEATRANHKTWLVKRIAWRLQALAEGELSQRARQRAAELACEADLRLAPPGSRGRAAGRVARCRVATQVVSDRRLPPAGTLLLRPYKGRRLEVQVLANGFAFEGQVYKSLSAVAKTITGQHCNGFQFFRLGNQGGQP